MSKSAKLAVLLSTAWFVVVLAAYLTESFSGNANDAFIAYLFAGLALINLAIWGYRWFNSAAAD
jgi:hypothetical protein